MFTCFSVLLSILIIVVLRCVLPFLHRVKASGSYAEIFLVIKYIIWSPHWLPPVFLRTRGCFVHVYPRVCPFVYSYYCFKFCWHQKPIRYNCPLWNEFLWLWTYQVKLPLAGWIFVVTNLSGETAACGMNFCCYEPIWGNCPLWDE